MKFKNKFIHIIFIIAIFIFFNAGAVGAVGTGYDANFAALSSDCKGNSFFGLTPWYKYLEFDSSCNLIPLSETEGVIYLILLAIAELMLNIAGFLAVVFVLYGGFKFITSQGEPQNIANSRKVILNALIGLVIALLASQFVKFIALKIGG